MVAVAASMAAAASTAFPPCWYIMEPAVAAMGFPVMAIQCLPWSTGFWVRWAAAGAGARATARAARARSRERRFMESSGSTVRRTSYQGGPGLREVGIPERFL